MVTKPARIVLSLGVVAPGVLVGLIMGVRPAPSPAATNAQAIGEHALPS